MTSTEQLLQQRLVQTALRTPWCLDALALVRATGTPDWCIGAGAIRGMVWDSMSSTGRPGLPVRDLDVAFFDPADISRERDEAIRSSLSLLRPEFEWDVVNQAGVHEWYPECFGVSVAPLASLEQAVGSWPEYATCVGLRLREDDSLEVIAPHGLHDLFGRIIRHNPARASVEVYRERVARKQFTDRWPGVVVVPA